MNNELAEAKLRIDIYREAWRDAEKETIKLREELAYQTKFRELYEKSNKERGIENDRLREENERLVRLQEENKKLREEIERLNTHKARYQQEITDLEADYEKLFKTLQSLRNTLQRCSDDIYSAIMVD